MRSLLAVICVVAIQLTVRPGVAMAQASSASAQRSVDTLRTPIDTGAFRMTKSPLTAVLLSAVLPGAGQVYLDQTWKVPIIWGIIGGFFYGEQIQNLRYHQAQHTVDSSYAMQTQLDTSYAHNWEFVREFYRDDRDKWWIYLGITYIATILDAYIASHLYDFDVSDPTPTVSSYYDPINRQVGMRVYMHF